jgi:hypothetical protein
MHSSLPSLHRSACVLPGHLAMMESRLAEIRAQRILQPPTPAPAPGALEIAITTVSLDTSFDAYIDVTFPGAPSQATAHLLLDSGNSMLILPRWEDIAALPNASSTYQMLGTGSEPWGCPANIVRGPIELATTSGAPYILQNCVFYACTANSPQGQRTGNFGAGCLSPWSASGWNTPAGTGVTMQAPLSYSTYPYVEFNYEPAASIFSGAASPNFGTQSSIVVHSVKPAGYALFDIIANTAWMALSPKSLTIGNSTTSWPGTTGPAPIAMIDTGGGPVFLSDPSGYVYDKTWPDPVANPGWTSGSSNCESIGNLIAIELGDAANSFSYTIDPSQLPPSVRGLTLVMCRVNEYMRGEPGMNIGGISALVNSILIDYQNAQIGMKSK